MMFIDTQMLDCIARPSHSSQLWNSPLLFFRFLFLYLLLILPFFLFVSFSSHTILSSTVSPSSSSSLLLYLPHLFLYASFSPLSPRFSTPISLLFLSSTPPLRYPLLPLIFTFVFLLPLQDDDDAEPASVWAPSICDTQREKFTPSKIRLIIKDYANCSITCACADNDEAKKM